MNNSRIIKLAAITTLFAAGVLVGSYTPDAEAGGGKCVSGMRGHSSSSVGYVCSSSTPSCSSGHEVFAPVYNSAKKRFDYKCTKSASIPK
jgi:hypothetical protein